MFPNKIRLTPDYINLIIKERKEHDLTAYQLSEQLGKNKSWLPNIENKRTKNISKEDFLALFEDFAEEEGLNPELYIIKHLSSDALVYLDDGRAIPALFLKKQYRLNEPSKFDREDELDEADTLETDSYFHELKHYIFELQDVLFELLQVEKDPQADQLFEDLETIRTNFLADYGLALRIYGINYFANLDVARPNESYLAELNSLVNETKYRFKLVNQRYTLYDYFKAPGASADLSYRINSCDPSHVKELRESLSYVGSYIEILSQYIATYFAHPHSNITDFHKLYSVADNFCKDFVRASKLNYSYDFKIPNDDSEESDVKDAQIQISNVFYTIKNCFKEKYHIH